MKPQQETHRVPGEDPGNGIWDEDPEGTTRVSTFPRAQFNAGLGAGSQTCGQENPSRHLEYLGTWSY